jgi:glucokinase
VNSRRFLGLDLGGTNTKSVVLEAAEGDYRVVASSTAPTHADRGPSAVVERLVELGRRATKEHGEVERVGLGIPGLFDRVDGVAVLLPNLPGPWAGVPLRASLTEGIGAPATLVNDARAFTLAEGRMGAGRRCSTLIGMTLGTGVGGGLLIDGRLHLGAWGRAGEIGHQTVVPDGPLCGCGNRGCVEAVAKAGELARLGGRPTAKDVYAGVRDGDARCRAAVETVAAYLGIGLANLVTVFGPECIVVGGGIVAAGDLVLDPIRAAIRERVTLVPADEINVVAASLGPAAGSIGAALAAADAL